MATTLLARTTAETVTTIDETAVIALVARMIGKMALCKVTAVMTTYAAYRDRDTKEDREEVRENGTNGEDRKGRPTFAFVLRPHPNNV